MLALWYKTYNEPRYLFYTYLMPFLMYMWKFSNKVKLLEIFSYEKSSKEFKSAVKVTYVCLFHPYMSIPKSYNFLSSNGLPFCLYLTIDIPLFAYCIYIRVFILFLTFSNPDGELTNSRIWWKNNTCKISGQDFDVSLGQFCFEIHEILNKSKFSKCS